MKYVFDILADLIPEFDVALSGMTVPRNRSVDKKRTKTDQVVAGGEYGSDAGIRDSMLWRKTVTNSANIWLLS